ncbi:MAG: flavin-containing monooxygenase [Acidimicrobiia bacterium]
MSNGASERTDTLVIGGGQAGLAVGYHLSQRDVPFLIVDASQRTGDSWRNRWDSLRLFTPNRFNNLPGKPIPGKDWGFPTKDEAADYLESYARHFELPIRHGVKVNRLTRDGGRFIATAGDLEFEADNVVVAMANFQEPKLPEFASELDPGIVQIHVADYKNRGQLRNGDVLVVGRGNSGAEIAMELVRDRGVWLSGRSTGQTPFRPQAMSGRILMPLAKGVMTRVLTTSTPIGRKARPKFLAKGRPLIRIKNKDLAGAGVERVPRTVGVVDGYPRLEDGRVLDVANVVWCTGFEPGFSWIHLPVFDEDGAVIHERGVVAAVPGLYFVGLKFLHSALSDTLSVVGRDAGYVVDRIVERRPEAQTLSR